MLMLEQITAQLDDNDLILYLEKKNLILNIQKDLMN